MEPADHRDPDHVCSLGDDADLVDVAIDPMTMTMTMTMTSRLGSCRLHFFLIPARRVGSLRSSCAVFRCESTAAFRKNCAGEGKKICPVRPTVVLPWTDARGAARGPRARVSPSASRGGAAMRTDDDIKRDVEYELM